MNTSDNVDKNVPKIDMSVVFEDIAVELEEIQYRTLLKLVDAISAYERAKRVKTTFDFMLTHFSSLNFDL